MQRHTETCNAHAGGSTEAQTGTLASSTVTPFIPFFFTVLDAKLPVCASVLPPQPSKADTACALQYNETYAAPK